MNTSAAIEIAVLRRDEARECAIMAEFELLLRQVWPHYACNFVLGNVPDGGWIFLSDRLWHDGMPPRDRNGWVVVSLNTLRKLARRLR